MSASKPSLINPPPPEAPPETPEAQAPESPEALKALATRKLALRQSPVTAARCGSARSGYSGAWVVVALVFLGIAAAVGARKYWVMQGKSLEAKNEGADREAGARLWDEEAANAELDELQARFTQVVGDGLDSSTILSDAQRLVERYPKYAAGRTLLAQAFMYRDQIEQGYDQLKLSLELDQQQAEVHLLAGTLALKLGRVEQAHRHYLAAVGLDVGNVRYRLHLAQTYLKLDQSDQARGALLEAIKIDSASHEAYFLLAEMYAQQNKLSLALPQLDRAIQHTPISERDRVVLYTRRKAKLLVRDQRVQEALLSLQNLRPQEQDDPLVMHEMAIYWSMLGRPGEAAELYEQALARHPTQGELAGGAAHWRWVAGDRQAAIKHLEMLRRINPRSELIAQLEAKLGQ